MDQEVSLRVKVVRPPSNVTFCLQRGKDDLVPPSSASNEILTFDLVARVNTHLAGTEPDFRGPFIHGRRGERFLYVNSGTRAGQVDSCWTRRAKVPLTGIGWPKIEEVLSTPGAVLEACIEGTAKDGGPACATVPLLGGAWTVIRP